MEITLSDKINKLLSKYYLDTSGFNSYQEESENSFLDFANPQSRIQSFLRNLEKLRLGAPTIVGPGIFPFYRLFFERELSKTDKVSKSILLDFYISTRDLFFTYYYQDTWIFHDYKMYTKQEFQAKQESGNSFPFSLHLRPPQCEIIYSEESLLHNVVPEDQKLIDFIKMEFLDCKFIPHQALYSWTYRTCIPHGSTFFRLGDEVPLFNLILDPSRNVSKMIVRN